MKRMITSRLPLTISGRPRRQKGIALLTALFVVALATIAAVALVSSSSIAIRRTENLQDSERAWWYADSAESWVKGILVEDAKENKTDSLADIWAQSVGVLPIEQGAIRGQVIDLQGLFNLNNLGAQDPTPYLQQFQRLVENIPDVDAFTAEGLGQAIRDWIDSDDERMGATGAEDGDYLSLDPPYRAANQPFRSVSELMAIRGMTPDIYTKLLPNVCALPNSNSGGTLQPTSVNTLQPTPININTATLPVLMSLAPNVDAQAAQAFTESRVKDPLTDTTQFMQKLVPQTSTGVRPSVGVTSQYFELQAEVVVGSARVALYSVFHRPLGVGPNAVPVVIAHSTDTE
jgi:general secretion pathway protein K